MISSTLIFNFSLIKVDNSGNIPNTPIEPTIEPSEAIIVSDGIAIKYPPEAQTSDMYVTSGFFAASSSNSLVIKSEAKALPPPELTYKITDLIFLFFLIFLISLIIVSEYIPSSPEPGKISPIAYRTATLFLLYLFVFFNDFL